MYRLLLLSLLVSMPVLAQDEQPLAQYKDTTFLIRDLPDDLKERYRALYGEIEKHLAEHLVEAQGHDHHQMDEAHMVDHLEEALSSGDLHLMLPRPDKPEVTVQIEGSYLRGNAQARVMIVEFFDSQCPFCSEVHGIIDRLLTRYRDKLGVVMRHYPLDTHPQAVTSAIALECAREQGRFDLLSNALLHHTSKQSMEDLTRYARQANMPDLDSFLECVREKRHAQRVEQDIAEAESVGVNATPSFIVGIYDPDKRQVTGQFFDGAKEYAEFTQVIDQYLHRLEKTEKP